MRFGSFFKKARLLETLLMTGFVLIAIPFLGPLAGDQIVKKIVLLFVGNFALLIAVYAANSYFGYKADRNNPRFEGNLFASPVHYIVVAALTLSFAIVLLGLMNPRLPVLGVLSFLLWLFYSAPGGAKSRPVIGTIVHIVGQVLQFHLCVLAFTEPTVATFLISLYFGFLFASGHLMHEVKDFESDRDSGIRTNAVVFGPKRLIRFYRAAIIFIPIYWMGLRLLDLVSETNFWPFFAASLLHVGLSLAMNPGSGRFQSAYRALYFIAGLVAIAHSSIL